MPTKKKQPTVLVLGGGVAGATVAHRMGSAGVRVLLVDKAPALGGRVRRMGCKATDVCLRCGVCVADEIIRSVPAMPSVEVRTSTRLAALTRVDNGHRFEAALASTAGSSADSSTVPVDAVVVAVGYEPYEPAENPAWGSRSVPNVVSGVEAERMLAEQGRLVRPSDGQQPARVAFVQCVGSRTEEVSRGPEDTNYCSTVCCAYALRMARQIQHQAGKTALTVFYMDIQNFGKGFNQFYRKSKETTRFVRSRPARLLAGDNGSVRVQYAPESAVNGAASALAEESFDLVVLSVGMRPPADGESLGGILGLPLDESGFLGLKTASALPLTQREGVYVAGACESPKDIAGCVAQAEAVSALLLADLNVKPAGTDRDAAYITKTTARPTDCEFKEHNRSANRSVVVVGGGIAGLHCASALSRLGHAVTLVEKSPALGGVAAVLPEFFENPALGPEGTVRSRVESLVVRVGQDKNIRLQTGVTVESVDGELGAFQVRIRTAQGVESVPAGAVVLAVGTGAASELGSIASAPAVIVDLCGLAERIRSQSLTKKNIALLLDVADEQGRAVSAQVLTAARVLIERFGCRVTLYCRNVRVAGTGVERLYRLARQAGARVVKYANTPGLVAGGAGVEVAAADEIAGLETRENFDLAVVAGVRAMSARPWTDAAIQGLRRAPDGALQGDDVWFLPASSNRPGIFVIGEARGNSDLRDAQTDGLAAAGEIHRVLSAGRIRFKADAATVDPALCVLCLTCRRICPHGAISVDGAKSAASVSELVCQRCGTCAAECPAKAIKMPGLDKDVTGKRAGTVVFACRNSAVPAMAALRAAGQTLSAQVEEVPCAGQVEPQSVLRALQEGARTVWILGCHPESCRYLHGSSRAVRRVARLADLLKRAGYEADRVRFGGLAAVEPQRIVEYLSGAGAARPDHGPAVAKP